MFDLVQNDLQKYQHRMKNLQTRSEQQSKVLRVKTEEVSLCDHPLPAMIAHLMHACIGSSSSEEIEVAKWKQ